MQINAIRLLDYMSRENIYKLILIPGSPIMVKHADTLIPVSQSNVMPQDTANFLNELATQEHKLHLDRHKYAIFAKSIPEIGRFRISAFMQRNSISMSITRIPGNIRPVNALGFSERVHEILDESPGLVLIAGPADSGKSTTFASFIQDIINRHSVYAITVENPIEYLLKHGKGIVSQIEVEENAHTYRDIIKYIELENPDIIGIENLQNEILLEAILKFAETKQTIFATITSNNFNAAINYFTSLSKDRDATRRKLAQILKALIVQRLVPATIPDPEKPGEKIKVDFPVHELIIPDDNFRMLIEENRMSSAYNAVYSGKLGSYSINQQLKELYFEGAITEEIAIRYSAVPSEMKMDIQAYKNAIQTEISETEI